MFIHRDDLVQFTRDYLERNPRSPWQLYEILGSGLELIYRIKPQINGNDLSQYIADNETYLVLLLPRDGSRWRVQIQLRCKSDDHAGLPYLYCTCYDRAAVMHFLANPHPHANTDYRNYYFRHHFMHDFLHRTTREEHRLYDNMYVPPSHHLMARVREEEQQAQRPSTTASLFQFLHNGSS